MMLAAFLLPSWSLPGRVAQCCAGSAAGAAPRLLCTSFGTAWPLQSWAGTGSRAGTAQLCARTVMILFSLIFLALFTKEKAKFIHRGNVTSNRH